jgi:hypothetical protein
MRGMQSELHRYIKNKFFKWFSQIHLGDMAYSYMIGISVQN